MVCLFYCVAISSPILATDFDERVQGYYEALQDHIYDRINWYKDGQIDLITDRSFVDSRSFSTANNTCTFDKGKNRYSDDNKNFVYANGENVPQDAITFAGVFDTNDQLEMAVFRGI